MGGCARRAPVALLQRDRNEDELAYLRVGLDLRERAFTGFQCNDQIYGPEQLTCIEMPAMAIWCMLNVAFWCEADTDRRAFLYLDSVVLSADAA